MLKVIKRDGRIGDFIPEKIKTSISNCENDVNLHLNQKELDLIAKEVEDVIVSTRGKDRKTSRYEIRGVITRVLKYMGYSKVPYCFYEDK
jgi:transcriptional regulator NrdR family protein